MAYDRSLVDRLLRESREIVLRELRDLFDGNRRTGYGPLYDLLADYPFREGKGLRPAISWRRPGPVAAAPTTRR